MNEFDKKIFECAITDEAFHRIQNKLYENPDFSINDENITEFIDCEYILNILKENKIEYKITTNDDWFTQGRVPQYNLVVYIYISQKDYVLIKHLLNQEHKFCVEHENDSQDMYQTKTTKTIDLISEIILSFTILLVGLPFFAFGIIHFHEDKTSSIIFIILGGTPVFFLLLKIFKLISKKITQKQ